MSLRGPQNKPPSSHFSGDIKHPRPRRAGRVNKHSLARGRLASLSSVSHLQPEQILLGLQSQLLVCLATGQQQCFPFDLRKHP